ncbi:TetR/AcrR family transcriptional regulator [Nocardia arizonensis]|uniref:TetR/AcrR family transcriptional regulator n=1 Tax=Nocardia arizonensis TaxID=1141647 RepID=UPI0009E736E0|nr:TetR/AcrR family transcriptional regulator [Nocardia arizonensis]
MSPRQTRSDAKRNREHLLAVARDALAEDAATSMNAIAKRAGVGSGTLYRHFPSREALVIELYRAEIAALVDLAPRLLEQHDALTALRRWLDEVRRYATLECGVAEVVHAAVDKGVEDPAYAPFVGAVDTLLRAGAAAGVLKPDLDPEDVLLQLSVLWRIDPAVAPDRPARVLALVVDGLRRCERVRPIAPARGNVDSARL